MFLYPRLRALLHSQTPKCYLLHSLNPFSTTSDSTPQSFTISFLTNNCGLSPQDALKASKRLRFTFNTSEKPNTVITFFKTHGFSDHQIQSIIRKHPDLLVSNPIKSLLPKFQFLSSKGVSPTDIVATVTRNPRFLRASLEKQIIPTFELVRSFCPSDQKAIDSIIVCLTLITDGRMKPNVQFLIDFGVTPSCIYHFLRTRPSIIYSNDLRKAVEEIKALGLDPSKVCFGVALLAKRAITKSQWDAKIDVLKRWGCSEDAIFSAFKKQPNFMLRSPEKLNAVMSFWVEEFGWDPSVLLATPALFGYSVENWLTPRALIVKCLLSKGLIKEGACLATPFNITDAHFQQRYVKRYKETSMLLKLNQREC